MLTRPGGVRHVTEMRRREDKARGSGEGTSAARRPNSGYFELTCVLLGAKLPRNCKTVTGAGTPEGAGGLARKKKSRVCTSVGGSGLARGGQWDISTQGKEESQDC